jgi:hypothetical protein
MKVTVVYIDTGYKVLFAVSPFQATFMYRRRIIPVLNIENNILCAVILEFCNFHIDLHLFVGLIN